MSKSDFIEPQPFSINENLLENTLINIASGKNSNFKTNSETKKDPVSEKNDILIALNSVPDPYKKSCIKFLVDQVSKFKRSIVCKNTKNITKFNCEVGKELNEIIYKDFSVQGNWTGLEVIIEGENSELIIAKLNGNDWEDMTKFFVIN